MPHVRHRAGVLPPTRDFDETHALPRSAPASSTLPTAFDADRVLRLARDTLDIEARALLGLRSRLGSEFADAVRAVLQCAGRVVVMGVGKSGHVGRKVAATLASTGTPALFVHAGEASHGDLGMVTAHDVVLALSNSGETAELTSLLPAFRRLGVVLVVITGRPESTLASHAQVTLSCAVDQEACPLNLAPTASTAAQMALGDALAVALLDARGFHAEDFARSHPGGALGRKLLTHVRDVMRTGTAVPEVGAATPFVDLIAEMSRKGMGATAVTDAVGVVLGIFTDGDLRRLLEAGRDLRGLMAQDVMHAAPRTVRDDALAVDAANLMEQHRITKVLVVDGESRLVGALDTNDLLRAKVI